MQKYHINEDGTIPCTNACGKNVKWSTLRDWWVHDDGIVACHWGAEADVPYEGQEACPEAPNDIQDEWTTPMKEKWL